MADDDDKKTDEKTDQKTDDKTDPWEKLTGVVRAVIKEEISAWQPQGQTSEKQEQEKETETPKKERRKGFLEDLFKGLTD